MTCQVGNSRKGPGLLPCTNVRYREMLEVPRLRPEKHPGSRSILTDNHRYVHLHSCAVTVVMYRL